MDNWQVAQNYIVAAAIGGAVGGYYYYTSNQKKPNRTGSLNALTQKRSETDLRGRNARRNTRDSLNDRSANGTPDSRQASSSAARKRKARAEVPAVKHQPSLDVIVDDKPAKESDMSAAQFANQMVQARQGTNLQSTKSKDTRVKTVKQKAAADRPAPEHEEKDSAESTDDAQASTAYTPAGDVSDMLEPAAPGPSVIRITPAIEPQRTKVVRQPKQEVVETKSQKKNRKKAEERKAMQAEAEALRKTLEERQRRTAREARGEPAKNGIPVATAPVNNPWEQRNANSAAAVQAADISSAHGALLDTFDAESTSSSNGGPGVSTAATSTTSGEPRWDSEETQMAAAIAQSNEESGWTTVATAPKKAKKKSAQPSGAVTPIKENGQASSGAYALLGNGGDWDA